MKNNEYLQHIATEGERWDTLAFAYYGNAIAYEQIVNANPHLQITTILSAGDIVFIPIIEKTRTNKSDIPPWLIGADDD